MKKLFKWIFWLAIVAGLGYGGYTMYNTINDEETTAVDTVEIVEETTIEAENEETNVELNTVETNE